MEQNKNFTELNEEALNNVSGGVNQEQNNPIYVMDMACPFCGQNSVYKSGRIHFCRSCDKEIPM